MGAALEFNPCGGWKNWGLVSGEMKVEYKESPWKISYLFLQFHQPGSVNCSNPNPEASWVKEEKMVMTPLRARAHTHTHTHTQERDQCSSSSAVCAAYMVSWRRRCRDRWSEREKLRLQSAHRKGLMPVCLRKWRVSSSERANFQEQPSQVHL